MTPTDSDKTTFLETAARIGRRLCRDALWHAGRCNWTGASMELLPQGWTTVERSFGPDLYGGTSGIGWFLSQLFRATGEPAFERTARGAIAQAWTARDDLRSSAPYAVYSGALGLAWVLIEASDLLGRGELLEQGMQLLSSAEIAPPSPHGVDVISGSAGAIPVFLQLASRTGRTSSTASAIRHGEHLLLLARSSQKGLSWRTISAPGEPDLTGFSHGASGIGWALTELFAATGEDRFRKTALAAFEFERQWFVGEEQNWADLRNSYTNGQGRARPTCSMAWCHGAPGIALARLRAFEVLGDPTLRTEGEIALATTASALNASATVEQSNYSQCHGHAGNAEALLHGGEMLAPEWREPAVAAAIRGSQRFGMQNAPWPCGVPNGGENPSLMLGLAGIGHFYLRLAESSGVPSATMIGASKSVLPSSADGTRTAVPPR